MARKTRWIVISFSHGFRRFSFNGNYSEAWVEASRRFGAIDTLVEE